MRLLGFAFPCFVLLAACGGDTTSDTAQTGTTGGSSSSGAAGSGGAAAGSGGGAAGGGGAGAGTAGAAAGQGGSPPCESFVPCCDGKGNPVTPTCKNGVPECPPGSAFPSSGVCMPPSPGCSPTQPCGSDAWCDYPDDLCGKGAKGVCKQKTTGCDLTYAPVCGCDGKVASNTCAANAAGVDVSAAGGCAPPMGTFACGPSFCEQSPSQYCLHELSDVGGVPDTWQCNPAPDACKVGPSCGCLKGLPCATSCTGDAKGNWTLTCGGG